MHVVALVDDDADLEHVGGLAQTAKTVSYARISARVRPIRSALAMLSGRPISVSHFYSRDIQAKIDEMIEELDFDAVICSSSPTAEYLFRSSSATSRLASVPRIMDLIDVDSRKWADYAESSGLLRSLVYRYEARSLAAYEQRIGKAFGRVLVVTPEEADLFRSESGCTNVIAVRNGVDFDFFSPSPQPSTNSTGRAITFVGVMDYFPNVDGMRWFIDKVLPRVKDRVSDAELFIVGSNPTPAVQAWGEVAGITVTGFVDDVRLYLDRSAVCIAPLRIARGVQNKVLEAMAMARPIVCSEAALTGIEAADGSEVFCRNEPDAFAEAICDLLEDPTTGQAIGRAAREFVESHYSWSACLQPINEIIGLPDLTGVSESRGVGARL